MTIDEKREFVARYCVQDFEVDDGVALIDAWDKANGDYAVLAEVLAKITKRFMDALDKYDIKRIETSDGKFYLISEVSIKDILKESINSEHFS
jgi:hypothetical protein